MKEPDLDDQPVLVMRNHLSLINDKKLAAFRETSSEY